MLALPHSRESHKHKLAAEVLRSAGRVSLTARGHSMLPTIWPGDLLTIESVPFDQIEPGDVILFERDERFFIHRVMRKCGGGESARPSLVTRGDSMPGPDSPVWPTELLGRIISLQRHRHPARSVPRCSRFRRALGLTLGNWSRLRSVSLRMHRWLGRDPNSALASQELGG